MDLISRQAAIDAIDDIESEVADGDGFQYEKWRQFFCDLPSANLQPTCTKLATDKISQFIDGLEEMFADIRERHIDDSVCGLCEYDGAYVGQSGDWCNECPGFEKDDCFKLSDKTRKKWTEGIIKALPSVEPERKIGTPLIEIREWIEGYENRWYRKKFYCASCGIKIKSESWDGKRCFGKGTILQDNNMPNFCPNCGADMRGEQDGRFNQQI